MKKKFLIIFFVIIILFVFFIILANWQQKKINGDADGGYYSEGHYYISSKGEFKEVTKTTWYISKVLVKAVIVFSLLFVICFIIFMLTIAFPFVIKLNREFIKENKWK